LPARPRGNTEEVIGQVPVEALLTTVLEGPDDMTTMSNPRRRFERAMRLHNGAPVEQHDEHRTCDHHGCETKLSRYNPNPSCGTHGGWADDPSKRSRDLL
jgi:hypothetical protein